MIIMYNISLITIIRFATAISQKYLSYASVKTSITISYTFQNPFWYVLNMLYLTSISGRKKNLKWYGEKNLSLYSATFINMSKAGVLPICLKQGFA